jgi:tripartite ATP-independent transporter DctM subunit
MVVFLFLAFIVFMLLGLDVGFSMVFSSFLGIVTKATRPVDLTLIPLSMVSGADQFTLVAIPLFILAGEIMNRGGITQRLVDFALALIGHVKGSLSHVAVITNIIMAGVSGSGVADASATGSILIPAMEKEGYHPAYSGAVVAAAATIGPIIPPSIPMIIYAVMANVSVAKLFLAGMLPGLILGIGFFMVCAVRARSRDYPKRDRAGLQVIVTATLRAGWALMMPVIVLGSIIFGVATVTEAATVAVVYALLVSLLIQRELSIKGLLEGLYEAGVTSGIIMILLAAAGIFSWLLAESQINYQMATFLLGITQNPLVLLVFVNILLLAIGCLLEPLPALIIFIPALIPLGNKLGIDPIHFGTVMVLNLMIGMLTPPVGFLLFVVSAIGDIPVGRLVREVVPFLLICLGVLVLVTYFPPVTMWIPSLMP